MKDSVGNDKLYEIIEFLSKEEGMAIDAFIAKTEERIIEEKKLAELIELVGSLSPSKRAKFLDNLSELSQATTKTEGEEVTKAKNHTNCRFKLEDLRKWGISEIANRKPHRMYINGSEISAKSWTKVTMNFAEHLIINNDLKKENLPLYLSSRSNKSFINATGEPDAGDGIFKKVGEGFYVDVKYNAKYHVINMQRTLKKLNITTKYNIEIEL